MHQFGRSKYIRRGQARYRRRITRLESFTAATRTAAWRHSPKSGSSSSFCRPACTQRLNPSRNHYLDFCSLSLASLAFVHYIHPVRAEEIDMILGTLNSSACLDETRIVTVAELPPKDPHDDDDNDEDEEDDDDEEDEKPAVIREPDEC